MKTPPNKIAERTIIDDLNTAVRVMRSARMLPTDGELSKDQIDSVRRDFTAYLKNTGLYRSEVAKGTGIATSTISQWANANYGGDVSSVTRKINAFLERHARMIQSKLNIDYVPTRVAEGLRTLAFMAVQHGSMARAVMPSGSGKTMVIRALVEELLGYYVYCDETMTPRGFLRELAVTVGVHSRGTAADIKRAIVKSASGSGRPIFLDEAHRLPEPTLPVVRTIFDLTGCPVIMCGTVEIIKRTDDTAHGRGQIASRCINYNALDRYFDPESKNTGGEALFTREEIKQLYAQSQVRLDRQAADMIWALASLPGQGCIRLTNKLVALVLTNWPDETITRDKLVQVLPMHFAERAVYVQRLADKFLTAVKTRKVA